MPMHAHVCVCTYARVLTHTTTIITAGFTLTPTPATAITVASAVLTVTPSLIATAFSTVTSIYIRISAIFSSNSSTSSSSL